MNLHVGIVEKNDNVDVNYEEIQSEGVPVEGAREDELLNGEEIQEEALMNGEEAQGEALGKEAGTVESSDEVETTQKSITQKEASKLNTGIEWSSDKSGEMKSVVWKTEFAPKRIFWGVLLVVAAIALIMGKLGYLNNFMAGIGFWDVILTIFFLVTLVEGVTKGRIGEILFSIAFLANIHDELLGLEAITPWVTLGAALLGTIGLKMIFPKAGRKHKGMVLINGIPKEKGICEETRKGSKITYENVFSSAVKYVAGEFSKVTVENAFGSMQVYFSAAQPVDGSAKVIVDSAFGSVTIYVPATWTVVDNAEHIFGGVSEKGEYKGDGQNVLYIEGEVVFGSLQIKYI